jgi:hypothetical protein
MGSNKVAGSGGTGMGDKAMGVSATPGAAPPPPGGRK